MGWASGTDMFDAMVDIALKHAPVVNTDEGVIVPARIRQSIIRDAYDAMEESDWDTQDESKYFQSDLLHLMHALGEIDDEDYDYYTERGELE